MSFARARTADACALAVFHGEPISVLNSATDEMWCLFDLTNCLLRSHLFHESSRAQAELSARLTALDAAHESQSREHCEIKDALVEAHTRLEEQTTAMRVRTDQRCGDVWRDLQLLRALIRSCRCAGRMLILLFVHRPRLLHSC